MTTLILSHAENIGDALASIPAITEHQRLFDSTAWFACQAIAPLLAPTLRIAPSPTAPAEQYRHLHISEIFGRFHQRMHMVDAYRAELGLSVPPASVYAELAISNRENAHGQYVVLSPHTKSDGGNVKRIPYDRWESLVRWLGEKAYTVVIVGGADDPPLYGDVPHVINKLGAPLDVVASLIAHARGTITVDNGISHLTQAVRVTPHLLFYPAILPLVWVSNRNPNAINHQEAPSTITADTMLRLTQQLLGE